MIYFRSVVLKAVLEAPCPAGFVSPSSNTPDSTHPSLVETALGVSGEGGYVQGRVPPGPL